LKSTKIASTIFVLFVSFVVERDALVDIALLSWLQSAAGQALLAELAERPLADTDVLPELNRLRRSYTAEQARAAVEQSVLRRRAVAKFPQAERLFFLREALEQASAYPVAVYRAQRFAAFASVSDCCCGIGGDAFAFAQAGLHVVASDRDALRLAIATANADALGLADRIDFITRDLLLQAPPAATSLFCDPGRRHDGKRRFAVEAYQPPLSHILGWRAQFPDLAVKLAPGVDLDELATYKPLEIDFVSLDGELKEATLYSGALASAERRATLLRIQKNAESTEHRAQSENQELRTENQVDDAEANGRGMLRPNDSPDIRIFSMTGILSPLTSHLSPPLAYLYEPDPAVIRASLVRDLAAQLDAAQLDADIAYFTADTASDTPFARRWRVLEWQPFNLKQLRSRLRTLDAGPVTVKKRGSPLDTDSLARQLSGDGETPLVVVLTKHLGKPIWLICQEAFA
jgi:hypothetical protein